VVTSLGWVWVYVDEVQLTACGAYCSVQLTLQFSQIPPDITPATSKIHFLTSLKAFPLYGSRFFQLAVSVVWG